MLLQSSITNAQAHKQETSNTQAHKQDISYDQAQKQETFKQTNYTEISLVWTLDIQSVVLRNSKYLVHNNFSRVLA